MFNLSSQRKNANRNYCLSYLSQKAAIKEPNAGEDVGGSYTQLVGVQTGHWAAVKVSMELPKKTKIRAFYELALPFLGFDMKDSKAACHRDTAFTAGHEQWLSQGTNLGVQQQKNGERNVMYKHNAVLLQPQRRMKWCCL